MSIPIQNAKTILDHTNMGVPIYAATAATWIPLKQWRAHPVYSIGGVICGAVLASIAEEWIPLENRHLRMLSLATSGVGLAWSLKNLCVVPHITAAGSATPTH